MLVYSLTPVFVGSLLILLSRDINNTSGNYLLFKNYIKFFLVISDSLNNDFKGATKLYFIHDLRVVIILFKTGIYKCAICTYSFGKLNFPLPVFSMVLDLFCILNFNVILIRLHISHYVILFSLCRNYLLKQNWCKKIHGSDLKNMPPVNL